MLLLLAFPLAIVFLALLVGSIRVLLSFLPSIGSVEDLSL